MQGYRLGLSGRGRQGGEDVQLAGVASSSAGGAVLRAE